MGHLIEIAYYRVFIDLTRYDFSEIFFSLRSRPPQNPSIRIMYIGWLSKTQHFVQASLKLRCPIPKTSSKWMTYFTKEAETWPNHFVERIKEFTKLSDIERESNKERSKKEPPIDIDLDGDTCFITFSFYLTM